MENQKKNQTFPKKQNPANFFKDNITEKMKNYFSEEGNSGITEKLKSLADKVLMKEKISSEEFELLGNIAYFVGTDVTSMEYLCKETVENMRARFSEFPFLNQDYFNMHIIFTNIEVSLFEEAKEDMKNLINSEITHTNRMVLGNVMVQIKNNLKKGEFPVKFARDVEEICSKSKLCYNDLLKFNSLINQQYTLHGKNLGQLATLYQDPDYNNMMQSALYFFDLQKFAVVYVDNILLVRETLGKFGSLFNMFNDEFFNQNKFEFLTFDDVRNHMEKLENEQAIQEGLKGNVEGDEENNYAEDLKESDFNFANKPDVFLKACFEEVAEIKIDSDEKMFDVINAILSSEDTVSNTYQYMAKYRTFETRVPFEELYPEVSKENFLNFLETCIKKEREEYETSAKKLLQEIPADNINRIVTYVNECICELCIKDAEMKGYLMSQINENQISTWKHLQQLIGIIEDQNILASGFMTYCNLANYLETKTNAKEIFEAGNSMADNHVRLSYFMMLKNFFFPELNPKQFKTGDPNPTAPCKSPSL